MEPKGNLAGSEEGRYVEREFKTSMQKVHKRKIKERDVLIPILSKKEKRIYVIK